MLVFTVTDVLLYRTFIDCDTDVSMGNKHFTVKK